MKGNFIDTLRYSWKAKPKAEHDYFFLETNYGRIRVIDTMGDKPVIINVPDGPNVIEHQLQLIKELSNNFRVVCFEYPGVGLSYPNSTFDYSYKHGADLLIQIMDILNIPKAALLFSCSNGFYAIQAVSEHPNKFDHVFLSQTPSVHALAEWSLKNIPSVLRIPILGQIINIISLKKLAKIWYKYALPKESIHRSSFSEKAHLRLCSGGCFCLSSLVQGLSLEQKKALYVSEKPITLVWGNKDFSHRKTDKSTINQHIKNVEIIEFIESGHFPELEETKKYVQLIEDRIIRK
jgi:pimeloyl-ACP methyl ester carboxylesterase